LTDDEDQACSDENLIKNLGTIALKYRRAVVTQQYSGDTYSGTAAAFGQAAIHERMKKAQLSHQAT